MKKLLCLLLALTLPLAALADTQVWQTPGARYQTVTFADQAPETLQAALAASPFREDALLQGVMITTMQEDPPAVLGRTALMAIRREDKTLLVWASQTADEDWALEVIAEDFLRANTPFEIVPASQKQIAAYLLDRPANDMSVLPAIRYDNEEFLIAGRNLLCYRCIHDDGRRVVINSGGTDGLLAVHTNEGGEHRETILPGCGTLRLSELSADDFPTGLSSARLWCEARPWPEGLDAVSSGVNLRAKKDSRAKLISWCERGAPMTILEESDGWYRVRVGDTEAWASANYVARAGEYFSFTGVHEGLSVAETAAAASLRVAPGGEEITRLDKGAQMHVLGHIDGWLHVCVSEAMGFHPDPEGQYGYIREKDVIRADSLLDLKYRK